VRRFLAVVLGAVAMASCGRKPDSTAQTCKVAADEAGAFLRRVEGDGVLQAHRMRLVLRDDLGHSPPPTHIAVVATASGITFHGNASDNDIAERLAAMHAKLAEDATRGRLPASPPHFDVDAVLLEIDATVPWSTVAKLGSAAQQAGFIHPIFVFARTSPNKQPPPSKLDAEIAAAADSANRATAFAALARRVAEPCPALTRLMSRTGLIDANVISRIPDALVECSCAVEPASVRNLFAAWTGTTWPVSFAPVMLAAGAPTLAFAATTPWSEVAPQLKAGATAGGFAAN